MSNLFITETSETPKIEFDSSKGTLLIKGRSIPENSIEFYKPLISSLNKYDEHPMPLTKVHFELEYFNTSSSKCILDILRLLEKIHLGENEVLIDWYYDEDDEEILEIGQDFGQLITTPFNLKIIPN